MLADRALQKTFRNFSTLVLVVALVTVTLHLVYAFIFRDVIAVGEIHGQIEDIAPGRQVRNVGPGQLRDARTAYWILTAVEVVTLPLLVRATRRVLDGDRNREIPGAWRAWGRAFRGPWLPRGGRELWTAIATGVAFAVIAGFLVERTGLLVVQAVDVDVRWLADGMVRGLSRAIGAPFGLVPLALGTRAKGHKGHQPNL
jgi:hypothetical protein